MTRDQFLDLLRKQAAAHQTDTQYARLLGVSPQYLCDILAGRREPGRKILEPLGYQRIVEYRKVSER